MTAAPAWSGYQEDAAEFFRSLGLEAETNVTIKGVRTSHDIDVLVRSRHAGFDVMWVVECKHWNSRVSKLHVLALREIVSDTGADRGILLAENGFQSGAVEAASLTNVHVTSLANTRVEARSEIASMRLSDLFDRVEHCREQYWSIPKSARIEHGLRAEYYEHDYSGDYRQVCARCTAQGIQGRLPIRNRSHGCADVPWKSASHE
jgi:restriction system protein